MLLSVHEASDFVRKKFRVVSVEGFVEKVWKEGLSTLLRELTVRLRVFRVISVFQQGILCL